MPTARVAGPVHDAVRFRRQGPKRAVAEKVCHPGRHSGDLGAGAPGLSSCALRAASVHAMSVEASGPIVIRCRTSRRRPGTMLQPELPLMPSAVNVAVRSAPTGLASAVPCTRTSPSSRPVSASPPGAVR